MPCGSKMCFDLHMPRLLGVYHHSLAFILTESPPVHLPPQNGPHPSYDPTVQLPCSPASVQTTLTAAH
jgi:hypothetical protein